MQEHQRVVVVVRYQSHSIFWKVVKILTYKAEAIKVCTCCVVSRSNLIDYYASVKTVVAAKSDIPHKRTLVLALSISLAMMSVPLLAMD